MVMVDLCLLLLTVWWRSPHSEAASTRWSCDRLVARHGAMTDTISSLLIAILLLAANAFYVAAEFALAAVLLVDVGGLFAQGAPHTEYDIKAAYLYTFGRFVEWPPRVAARAAPVADVEAVRAPGHGPGRPRPGRRSGPRRHRALSRADRARLLQLVRLAGVADAV